MAATVNAYKLNIVERKLLADMKKLASKRVYGIGCPPCESFIKLRWMAIKVLRDNCELEQADADCMMAKLYEHCA
jgi:hypothetical protein